ncbi:MAG: enoyl-CoA hydratase/isomerase family protein [Thermodesulfobacteriota bacterium]|jgi:enoyl-CoA hydratase
MNYETIIFEKKEAVAKITLNRPQALNAMNDVMFREIGQALEDSEEDNNIRVVVITGNGRAFCSGVDLKFAREKLTSQKAKEDFYRLGNRVKMRRIEEMSKPVIAAVNGFALAGGFEIVLACDLAIAAEDATIGDQHMNYGLFGAGGSPYRLPLLVGIRKAKELIFTGKWISGKEAERIGLVNRAVPADQLESAVDEMVAQLADKSPVAMRISKAYINRTAFIDADSRLELLIMSALVLGASEDSQEGMRAFAEKRKPVYKGR